MKKSKDDEKSINIRIKETTIKKFDDKLKAIYEKETHRKQSHIIKKLITDFNETDTSILKQYIADNKPLINADADKLRRTIDDKDAKIESLEKTITEIKQETETIEKQQAKIIDDKDAIIKELTEKYNMLQQQQTLIINNSLREKDNLIFELKRDKKKLIRDNKQSRKEYNSLKAEKDKINNALFLMQQRNNKLTSHIDTFKNLSFFKRLFNYPSDIDADDDNNIIAIDNFNAADADANADNKP